MISRFTEKKHVTGISSRSPSPPPSRPLPPKSSWTSVTHRPLIDLQDLDVNPEPPVHRAEPVERSSRRNDPDQLRYLGHQDRSVKDSRSSGLTPPGFPGTCCNLLELTCGFMRLSCQMMVLCPLTL